MADGGFLYEQGYASDAMAGAETGGDRYSEFGDNPFVSTALPTPICAGSLLKACSHIRIQCV